MAQHDPDRMRRVWRWNVRPTLRALRVILRREQYATWHDDWIRWALLTPNLSPEHRTPAPELPPILRD